MNLTRAARRLSGGSLAAIQQVLGHSTVVTTQRCARLDEEAIRQEAEKLLAQQNVQQPPRPRPVAPRSPDRL